MSQLAQIRDKLLLSNSKLKTSVNKEISDYAKGYYDGVLDMYNESKNELIPALEEG